MELTKTTVIERGQVSVGYDELCDYVIPEDEYKSPVRISAGLFPHVTDDAMYRFTITVTAEPLEATHATS